MPGSGYFQQLLTEIGKLYKWTAVCITLYTYKAVYQHRHHFRITQVSFSPYFRKAIFIFLSNTGGSLIAEKQLEMWENGTKREDITLKDFEDTIRKGAFNEKGKLEIVIWMLS